MNKRYKNLQKASKSSRHKITNCDVDVERIEDVIEINEMHNKLHSFGISTPFSYGGFYRITSIN